MIGNVVVFIYWICYYNYVNALKKDVGGIFMKKVIRLILPICIVCGSIISIYAASKTKSVSMSCSYGSASENVTCTVSLSTIKSPSFSYSNQKHSDNIGKRWSGFSHSVKKSISGDKATYTNTAKASWTDYNYITQSAKKNVIFEYSGSLK